MGLLFDVVVTLVAHHKASYFWPCLAQCLIGCFVPVGHKTYQHVVWTWCNASYGADFCLRWTPEQLACAFMYGAARDLGVEVCACRTMRLLMRADQARAGSALVAGGIPRQPRAGRAPHYRSAASSRTSLLTHAAEILSAFFRYCRQFREPRDPGVMPPMDPSQYACIAPQQVPSTAPAEPAAPDSRPVEQQAAPPQSQPPEQPYAAPAPETGTAELGAGMKHASDVAEDTACARPRLEPAPALQ